VTFLLLATLGGWWTVLIYRLVEENHAQRVELYGATPEVEAEHDRKRLMLLGESAFMSFLGLSVVWLAGGSVRQERAGMRRLEGMLAASTHELKTPVAGVRALLESLASGVLPPERMAPHVARGLEACMRLEHLIEGILAYQSAVARPGGDVEIRAVESWIDPVLAHRVSDGIEDHVAVDLGAAASVPVRATPGVVRVVMENLLDNARKYGGDAPVRVYARVAPDAVLLEVSDEGEGFPPEDAEALFEPYQRGRAQDARHGTGLGLYLARTLARGIQGDLSASSRGPGTGATFTFSMRRADA
jgi:two-component system sensor histidine kinase KdpD